MIAIFPPKFLQHWILKSFINLFCSVFREVPHYKRSQLIGTFKMYSHSRHLSLTNINFEYLKGNQKRNIIFEFSFCLLYLEDFLSEKFKKLLKSSLNNNTNKYHI